MVAVAVQAEQHRGWSAIRQPRSERQAHAVSGQQVIGVELCRLAAHPRGSWGLRADPATSATARPAGARGSETSPCAVRINPAGCLLPAPAPVKPQARTRRSVGSLGVTRPQRRARVASVQQPPFRCEATAASTNLMPRAPSATVGKSSASGSGLVPVRRATIASAASAYRLANASWKPSGCRVRCASRARPLRSARGGRASGPGQNRRAAGAADGSAPPDATRARPGRRTRGCAARARRRLGGHPHRAARATLEAQQQVAIVVHLPPRHHAASSAATSVSSSPMMKLAR